MEGIIFKNRTSNVVNMNTPRIWSKQPVNRSQRRIVEKEYDTNDVELGKIEDTFVYEILFGETGYCDAYPELLLAYERMCEWIEAVRKPKGIILNKEYFINMYKPVEIEVDEFTGPWYIMRKIHSKIRQIKFVPGAEMMIGITNFKEQIKV